MGDVGNADGTGETQTPTRLAEAEAVAKHREQMREVAEKERLKKSLLGPDEIYLEEGIIRKIHAALEEALGEMPGMSGESHGRCLEALNWAWTNTRMILSWHEPEGDIDTSDNDRAESAQEAKNSSNQEGAAQ